MDFSNNVLYSASFLLFFFWLLLILEIIILDQISVFILDFIGMILIKECWQKCRIHKNDIKRRWPCRWMVYRKGCQLFWTLCTHTARLCFKFKPSANSEFLPSQKHKFVFIRNLTFPFVFFMLNHLQEMTNWK